MSVLEISKPNVKTYVVLGKDGVTRYTIVAPSQVMTSGMTTCQEFLTINEWITRLEELGVDTTDLAGLDDM